MKHTARKTGQVSNLKSKSLENALAMHMRACYSTVGFLPTVDQNASMIEFNHPNVGLYNPGSTSSAPSHISVTCRTVIYLAWVFWFLDFWCGFPPVFAVSPVKFTLQFVVQFWSCSTVF